MKFDALRLRQYSEYSFTGDVHIAGSTFIWADLSVDPSDHYNIKYGGYKYPIIAGHPGTAVTSNVVHAKEFHNSIHLGYPKLSGQCIDNWDSNIKIDSIERTSTGEAVFYFAEEPRTDQLNKISLLNPIYQLIGAFPSLLNPPYVLYWSADGLITRIDRHQVNSDGSLSVYFSSNVNPFATFAGIEIDRVDWHQNKVVIWPSTTGTLAIKGVFDSSGNPVPEFKHTFSKSAISVEDFALGDNKYQVKTRFKNTLEDYVNSRIAQWAQQNLR